LGLLPPADLRFHIREAVEVAKTKRIGHGVAIAYERDAAELLEVMRQRNVLVEICLTSNDVILGVKGPQHPFLDYLKSGVPVTLATDDEGVSRMDLTREYVRAAATYRLGYQPDLQLPLGREPLATPREPPAGRGVRGTCARQPSPACQAFLDASEKARMQWALERAFDAFEDMAWGARSP